MGGTQIDTDKAAATAAPLIFVKLMSCSIFCVLISNQFIPCFSKSKDMAVSQEVLDKLESEFAKLESSDSKSLLKKYLTREVFDKLKTKQTTFGSTLLDCVQSGMPNPNFIKSS